MFLKYCTYQLSEIENTLPIEIFNCFCTYFAILTCNRKLLESILSNSIKAMQLHTISGLSKFLKARICAYKAVLNFLKVYLSILITYKIKNFYRKYKPLR